MHIQTYIKIAAYRCDCIYLLLLSTSKHLGSYFPLPLGHIRINKRNVGYVTLTLPVSTLLAVKMQECQLRLFFLYLNLDVKMKTFYSTVSYVTV